MKHTIIYVLLAIACGAAYPFGRAIMIKQGPEGFVSTSSFTLNYLLLFVLVGTISPWIANRTPLLKRYKPSVRSGIVMITLVSALLIVLTLVGMSMRWSE